MKKEIDESEDELRPEYDFSQMAGGVKGKYIGGIAQGQIQFV